MKKCYCSILAAGFISLLMAGAAQADVIGVRDYLGWPDISAGQTGSYSYDAATHPFSLTSTR